MEQDHSSSDNSRTRAEIAELLDELATLREVSVSVEELTSWLLSRWMALLGDDDRTVRNEARDALDIKLIEGSLDPNLFELLVGHFEQRYSATDEPFRD